MYRRLSSEVGDECGLAADDLVVPTRDCPAVMDGTCERKTKNSTISLDTYELNENIREV